MTQPAEKCFVTCQPAASTTLQPVCACPGSDEPDGEQKGLFSLPFMKRAMEKRKLEAQQEAQEVRMLLSEREVNKQLAASLETLLTVSKHLLDVVEHEHNPQHMLLVPLSL